MQYPHEMVNNFRPVINENNFRYYEQRNEESFYLDDGRIVSILTVRLRENNNTYRVTIDRTIGNNTLREVTLYNDDNNVINRRYYTRGFEPNNDNVNDFLEKFNNHMNNNQWRLLE